MTRVVFPLPVSFFMRHNMRVCAVIRLVELLTVKHSNESPRCNSRNGQINRVHELLRGNRRGTDVCSVCLWPA